MLNWLFETKNSGVSVKSRQMNEFLPKLLPEAHHTSLSRTLVDVGEAAFALVAPAFFFLILIPGTGAELRASRKPVDSMAAARQSHSCESASAPVWTCAGLDSRCAGMILTLISLAELEGVFKGLYFFSKGVFSKGPELKKTELDPCDSQVRLTLSWFHSKGHVGMNKVKRRGTYRGLFRTGGLMLYLSPSCGAAGIFLAGRGLGASISSPATQKAASCRGSVSRALGVSDWTHQWSGSWRGWGHVLSACLSFFRHQHFSPSH